MFDSVLRERSYYGYETAAVSKKTAGGEQGLLLPSLRRQGKSHLALGSGQRSKTAAFGFAWNVTRRELERLKALV
jgi:hypothetical protein